MKMKHAFGPIILACLLFFIVLLIPSKSLVSLISDKKIEDAATSLQKEKLQSVFLQQKMLENSQYLPMYGSSEFLRMDAYHPSNYFKVNPTRFYSIFNRDWWYAKLGSYIKYDVYNG